MSLDLEQRRATIIAAKAPADVVTGPGVPFDRLGPPAGLAYSAMGEESRALLRSLVEEYAGNLADDLAAAALRRMSADDWAGVHFAWAGAGRPDMAHYFRVHGPHFAIEYDNVQGGANHIHTVWHDLDDPFGEDLLRRHRALHHK